MTRLVATLLLLGLAGVTCARPPQAPRPPQFPRPGAIIVIAAPPACGLSGCTCGCRTGEVCRCAAPVAVPAYRPVYQPAFYQPAFRPAPTMSFGGGGGGC